MVGTDGKERQIAAEMPTWWKNLYSLRLFVHLSTLTPPCALNHKALNPQPLTRDPPNRLSEDTTVVVKPYTLPDGRVIKIGQERFQCAEVS